MLQANPISQASYPHESLPHKQTDTHAPPYPSLHHTNYQACFNEYDRFYLSNNPDLLSDVLMLKLQGVLSLRMAKMERVGGALISHPPPILLQ